MERIDTTKIPKAEFVTPPTGTQKKKEPVIDVEAEEVKETPGNSEDVGHEEFRNSIKPEKESQDSVDQKQESAKFAEKSKIIDISEKDKGVEESSKVKVNFMNKGFMEGFVNKQTKKSEKEKEEGKETNKDSKDKKSDSKNPGASKAETKESTVEVVEQTKYTEDDFKEFAEIFIEVLDMGISTLLRFWAKDTSTAEYELPADKKRKLAKMLVKLFIKYQTKFSIEFMFCITLVICYSVPVNKARTRRKALNAGIAEPRKPGQPKKR